MAKTAVELPLMSAVADTTVMMTNAAVEEMRMSRPEGFLLKELPPRRLLEPQVMSAQRLRARCLVGRPRSRRCLPAPKAS